VKPLTYNQRRLVTGMIIAALLLAMANYWLRWDLFGAWDWHVARAALIVGLILVATRYLPGPEQVMRDHDDARGRAEIEANRLREKSKDAVQPRISGDTAEK